MKKNNKLSQRDVQKLEAVRKMISCSAEFRTLTIASIVKNVITESFTDDDAQKAALLLANRKFCVSECTRNYRILCETIIKNPQAFNKDLVRKALSFAKANKLTLLLPQELTSAKTEA